jgi:hypothetical protein
MAEVLVEALDLHRFYTEDCLEQNHRSMSLEVICDEPQANVNDIEEVSFCQVQILLSVRSRRLGWEHSRRRRCVSASLEH